MSNVVVSQFMSLDGVVEDPAGSEGSGLGAWSFSFNRGPDGDKFKFDEAMNSDALLLGRKTYDIFADSWPTRDGEFADKYNSMPKYVVSTTLEQAKWNNSTLIKARVPETIAELRQQPGGDILVNGSVALMPALMEHDLIDEYRLMVFPVVLGRGKRLFKEGGPTTTMALIDSQPLGPDGIVLLTYRPVREKTA